MAQKACDQTFILLQEHQQAAFTLQEQKER